MSDNKIITTRFAPSPTGYLHLGHAYSAILNYEAARQNGGRFLLRIEDIDRSRCKPQFELGTYEDLQWLGLKWELPVRRQSDRLHIYEAKMQELHERGLVYRCFKTRKDIDEALRAPHAPIDRVFRSKPLPPFKERQYLEAGEPFAWRLSMSQATEILGEHPAIRHGDVVLGRKDIGTSYHLSCVMDDADQGVTNVIRGQDLADIEDLHDMLFRLLGHEPPVFEHHQLVVGENGQRLAKRDQSIKLRTLRDEGMTPADIRARLPQEP